MKTFLTVFVVVLLAVMLITMLCGCPPPKTDDKERSAQEDQVSKLVEKVGQPSLPNGRERQIMKMIYELRDRVDFFTYAYTFSDFQGKFIYLGKAIGYPIPYGAQFSAPETMKYWSGASEGFRSHWGFEILPQREPNGLYSPPTAEGSWLIFPKAEGELSANYFEARINCTEELLPDRIVIK